MLKCSKTRIVMINDLFAGITVFYCSIAIVLAVIDAVNDSDPDENEPHYEYE